MNIHAKSLPSTPCSLTIFPRLAILVVWLGLHDVEGGHGREIGLIICRQGHTA